MLEAHIVADVMTRDVICVPPWATFREVKRILNGYNVPAVPVVDAAHHVLGMVSETDLTRTDGHSRPSHRTPRNRRTSRARTSCLCASELMNPTPAAVDMGTDIRAAARLLGRRGVARLVVVDGFGRLAGVVSRGDMLRAYGQASSSSDSIHGTLLPDVDIPQPR